MKTIKKISSIVICVIILSLSLSVCAFATEENAVLTFSDEYKELYYNGYTYVPVDASKLFPPIDILYSDEDDEEYEDDEVDVDVESDEYYYEFEYDGYKIEMTDEQAANLDYCEAYDSGFTKTPDIIIDFTVNMKNSAYFTSYYIREDYEDLLNDFLENPADTDNCEINLMWTEPRKAKFKYSVFFENAAGEFVYDPASGMYYYANTYHVYRVSENSEFYAIQGALFLDSNTNKLYYIDCEENNVSDLIDIFYSEEKETFIVHEITNSELIKCIQDAETAYYNEAGIFTLNDDVARVVSIIFLTIIFGVLPLAAIIISLILTLKRKGAYQKLLFAITFISALEIAIFIISAFIIFK